MDRYPDSHVVLHDQPVEPSPSDYHAATGSMDSAHDQRPFAGDLGPNLDFQPYTPHDRMLNCTSGSGALSYGLIGNHEDHIYHGPSLPQTPAPYLAQRSSPNLERGLPNAFQSVSGKTIKILYDRQGKLGNRTYYMRTPRTFLELLKGNDWFCPICATRSSVESIYTHLVEAHAASWEMSPLLTLMHPTMFRDKVAEHANCPLSLTLWEADRPAKVKLVRSDRRQICHECDLEFDSPLEVRLHAAIEGHQEVIVAVDSSSRRELPCPWETTASINFRKVLALRQSPHPVTKKPKSKRAGKSAARTSAAGKSAAGKSAARTCMKPPRKLLKPASSKVSCSSSVHDPSSTELPTPAVEK